MIPVRREIDEHSDTEPQRTTVTSPSSHNKPTTTTPKRACIINEDEDDDIDADPAQDELPPEDNGTEDEDNHAAVAARAKRDSSSMPLTQLANGNANGDNDDDDTRSAVVSDDASIDIEWAIQVKPPRQHLDWDDSPDFSFLPRRHAIARTHRLARHAARLQVEDLEELNTHDKLVTTRKLSHDKAAALVLEAALALAEASPTTKANPDTPPPDEEAEPVTPPPWTKMQKSRSKLKAKREVKERLS